jgi:hypothetical protein
MPAIGRVALSWLIGQFVDFIDDLTNPRFQTIACVFF